MRRKENTFAKTAKELKLVAVSRIRVTVAVGAVLLWAVTPVLACLLPCLAATGKLECSHQMAMHCGHSTITAGRNCCQVSSRPEMTTVETQVSQAQRRLLVVVPAVGQVASSGMTIRSTPFAFFESPPDEAPPASSSILRI
jgi:hypothetical protein